MPVIYKEEINQYPELKRFLEVDSDDKQALDTFFSENNIFNTTYYTRDFDELNLFQICAALGKLEHFRVLFEKNYSQNNTRKLHDTRTDIYSFTAVFGHLEILKYLEEKAPDDVLAMIQADNYQPYRLAARNGHLDVLNHLEAKAPDDVLAMIQANNYESYRFAVQNGHLDVLKHLEEKAPDDVLAMIQANNYESYRLAAKNGHLDILRHLEEIAPDDLLAMIRANNYESYRLAAHNGHLDVLRHLEEIAPEDVPEMIQASNHEPYLFATIFNQLDVINHLQNFPLCFAFAESHDYEYGEQYIYPFVEEKLNELQAQKQAAEQENPNAVFDVTGQECELYFYILRNLIRRNNDDLLPQINELLTLPSLQALLTQSVNQGPRNELFRLSAFIENYAAADSLSTIPAVRMLAEENSFYQDAARVHGDMDFDEIVSDPESSMRALNQAEKSIVDNVKQYYQDSVQDLGGVDNIFENFKVELQQRYNHHPASIERNGELLKLPFDWDDFQTLELTGDQRQSALEAYYKHDEHTAFRYVSKPNKWMAEDAEYINISADGKERWSTFEKYIETIATFWMAAADENTPATDGHTIENRKDIFIKQLALIGRTHNWDKTREVLRNGSVKQEEYDDLEGDKPSCYSGVYRRLFQSVLGHPLFEALTPAKIDQEIKSFVYNHFKTLFDSKNKEELQADREHLDQAFGLGDEEEEVKREESPVDALAKLDITKEQVDKFSAHLKQKYGAQFSNVFERTIKSRLNDKREGVIRTFPAHMIQFSESAGLRELLERKIEQVHLQYKDNNNKNISVASANQGFWSSAQRVHEDEEEKKKKKKNTRLRDFEINKQLGHFDQRDRHLCKKYLIPFSCTVRY